MTECYLIPGLRTPFVKANTAFRTATGLSLSAGIAKAMTAIAKPDILVWGQVIPDPSLSNIARELLFEAKLNPEIPCFSDTMACSTSFMGAIIAAGIVGRTHTHLAMVGGVETMSHVPVALKQGFSDKIIGQFPKNPAGALATAQAVAFDDLDLPLRGWANRVSGRTMGEHTEDTAKLYHITREAQDRHALSSHKGAIRGWEAGFYDDLVVPTLGIMRDTIPRSDTSIEKLASLPLVFDRTSGRGTITAGNSAPNTDGAASLWVADRDGLLRLGNPPAVRLIDWEITAMEFGSEGILMAPARAIPRVLARNTLKAMDVALWEIHEAFAAQVLANLQQISDPVYRREKAKVDFDPGAFPYDRVNPHGGSLALGHPFAATGARILSQASKELSRMASGSRAIVSVCADGGQGTVALLETP